MTFPVKTLLILTTIISSNLAFTLYAKPYSSMVLPKGNGLFKLSYRSGSVTDSYNDQGKMVPTGDAIRTDLSAANMTSLDGRLAELVKELNEYGKMENGLRLGDSLLLGTVTADAKAQIDASIMQFGYGLTRNITIFGALTHVRASVDAKLKMKSNNNALQIAESLGELAYDQVIEGLNIASRVSVTDVEGAIVSKGYKPVENWQDSSMGDIYAGFIYGQAWRLNRQWIYDLALIPNVTIPTGYVEQPDYLQDISVGKGHYRLGLGVNQLARIKKSALGFNANYSHGFTATQTKRVPVHNEPLMDKDRTTEVEFSPGDEVSAEALITHKLWRSVSLGYRIGHFQHFEDSYSGKLPGNYGALSKDSHQVQNYQEMEISFDSISLFKRKKFVYPFAIALSYHDIYDAMNADDLDYWQVSLTGYF